MEVHLMLTALLVSFTLLTSVQPKHSMGIKVLASQVNEEVEIEGNFRNLFDSIKKNDVEKADTYRNVLEEQALRERLVFHAMKAELRTTREREAMKLRQSHNKNGNDVERSAAVFKRALIESDSDETSAYETSEELSDQLSDETGKRRGIDEPRAKDAKKARGHRSKVDGVHRENVYRFLYFSTEGITVSSVLGMEDTNRLVPGGIEKEAARLFENAREVLVRNGSTLELVYALEMTLANMNDTQIVDEIFKKYFKEPYPKKKYKHAVALPLRAKIAAEVMATMTVDQLNKRPNDFPDLYY